MGNAVYTWERLHAKYGKILKLTYIFHTKWPYLRVSPTSVMVADRDSALKYAKKLSSASKKIGKHLDNGDIVNVKPWLYWMAADIVGELYFGKDFGMLENEANSINGYRFGTPFRYSS
ncbi:hypothetical protein TWF132_005177 [Orbilia oligospora]|nr:hypothetical protein TWF132_005177 [Orbilia oligospora]